MDSSSGSESGKALKLQSRDGGGISPRDIEIAITSISSSDESQPENLEGYGGNKDSSLRLEIDLSAKSQFSDATSSYSSSDKHSVEYIRVMPSEETKTDKDVLLSPENSNSTTASSSSTELASMVSDVTHESQMHCVSPVRSPPLLQVMNRLGGYQPGRIPSSVFERSPGSTPVEWSIASNESLFSIHIGNISFSKDRFLMVSGELQKSGDLPQFDEATSTSQLPEYEDNASDGPLAELERNFLDNEIAATMSNGDMLNKENGHVMITEKRDDLIVTRMMPSLDNEWHDQSSELPICRKKQKMSTCSCRCTKPGFRWLRIICCWPNNCACPSSCSWPSCQCQCPSFNCNCTAPHCCDCSCLTCCFKRPSCCTQECSCCFPSRKSAAKLEPSSSCWSCDCKDSCCTCSSCCTLSFSRNFCCSSCFGCHRKCRCCC